MATRKQLTQEAPQNSAGSAIAAPATQDKGPPPARPAQPLGTYNNPVANAVYAAASPVGGHEIDNQNSASVLALRKERVQAVDVFRQPPIVHQYKAEMLAWLDALATYHAS